MCKNRDPDVAYTAAFGKIYNGDEARGTCISDRTDRREVAFGISSMLEYHEASCGLSSPWSRWTIQHMESLVPYGFVEKQSFHGSMRALF